MEVRDAVTGRFCSQLLLPHHWYNFNLPLPSLPLPLQDTVPSRTPSSSSPMPSTTLYTSWTYRRGKTRRSRDMWAL